MLEASAQKSAGVLLTGGTGLLGRAIADELARRNLRVLQAVRSPHPQPGTAETLLWRPEQAQPFSDPRALEGLRAAIHLSGANLAAHRWTPAFKQEIVSSRTGTTTALARTLATLNRPPRVLITASATGIYGDRGDEVLTEASPPGTGFLSETCQAWEASSQAAEEAGIRVVHLRLGVVLAPGGGALAKVLPLFRAGLGGRLGSGRQWMSWVALADVVAAVLAIAGLSAPHQDQPERVRDDEQDDLEHDPLARLAGPVNCVAPTPVTNAEYTRALGKVLHRPAVAAAPAFALRLALGEMADAALLASCRAVPERLTASGFRFLHPEIEPALHHLLAAPG